MISRQQRHVPFFCRIVSSEPIRCSGIFWHSKDLDARRMTIKILNENYSPKPSIICKRLKFHSRVRQSRKSVSDFIESLRNLANSSNFQAVLKDMHRDRLVCGINNNLMQIQLLEDWKLTFEKAVKVVLAMKSATKDAQEITVQAGTTSAVETNHLSAQTSRKLFCFHCGKTRAGCMPICL